MGIVGAAYSAMLIGWLAYDSADNTRSIREALPDECPFSSLAALLKLFMAYQQQAGILPEYLYFIRFFYMCCCLYFD